MKPFLFSKSLGLISLFTILLFLFSNATAFAQLGLGLAPSDISLTLDPENPGPHQQVTVSIDSFATDLNSTPITWNVNGKKVLSGIGQKQITVSSGNIGQKTTITILIDSQTGLIEKDVSIIPSSVDLIWEADTYTPPFFKGKPLFSPESTITFIAVPHLMRNGVEVSSGNLIYKWTNNGTVLGDRGGYGKSTLSITGSILPRPMDISVEATDPVGAGVADGEVSLTPLAPFVLLYKNDPLYGVQYEKALQGNFSLLGNEIDMVAVPYYFSTPMKDDANMSYTWQINGTPINDGINSSGKIFRSAGDTSGISNISVSASQSQTMFQTAQQSVMINFQKNTAQTSL